MTRPRKPSVLGTILLAAAAAAGGCGGENIDAASEATVAARSAAVSAGSTAAAAQRTTLVVRDSQYGRMLFGPNRQAIYIFERDRRDESRCYGDCARAWPPVYTRGAPVAGAGVRSGLLGTIRRRNGRRQVTYRGKPLYYYAHEGPGEVRCHNVFLNGGLWWVVGPNGKRRP